MSRPPSEPYPVVRIYNVRCTRCRWKGRQPVSWCDEENALAAYGEPPCILDEPECPKCGKAIETVPGRPIPPEPTDTTDPPAPSLEDDVRALLAQWDRVELPSDSDAWGNDALMDFGDMMSRLRARLGDGGGR